MLNADTKRRINACRDILVGKVTDPKAQVEQITIALMYKFMNDLDHEVRDLGGTSSFFAGEFATYSWDRITDTRLGGEERIRLYAEGIEAVVKNPAVPELFRQIFRNAYLPYRDPETFNLFSREISGFTYDHSEDLGDAFEYLLSVMQSQGDAGQFRTPRHIIDFMVAVVDPQPGETILDPACGTAGFLISAFKHIAQRHRLTPAQLEDLHRQVEGYDISPDMVRLSRVNLYLHQFADPRVVEYDTLTSEDRWGQRFDVILANPPFMTPKGGIRPHRKFSLESNRSEVLFVDYIAEHLMADGRAAVIVPEGVIFQSGKAYKALRKLLVENSLWAVVSLPAGVFNPYSGVKTSILFLDRGLAERGGPVLFAQVQADGFDLGAQRRAVTANDLPAALALLQDAHGRLDRGEVPYDHREGLTGHTLTHLFVPRPVLLAEGDTNLSGERYRPRVAAGPQKWPRVKLGDVCELKYGFTASAEDSGDARFLRITDIAESGFAKETDKKYITLSPESNEYLLFPGDLLVARTGATYGKSMLFVGGEKSVFASYLIRVRPIEANLDSAFIHQFFQTESYWSQARTLVTGGGQPQFNGNALKDIEIPLPPLAVQQEIVAEVARYQAVIDGARQVVEHWKPTFAVDPEWPVVKLGEVADQVQYGLSEPLIPDTEIGYRTFRMNEIFDGLMCDNGMMKRCEISAKEFEKYRLNRGDVLFNRTNSYELVGKTGLFDLVGEYTFASYLIRLAPNRDVIIGSFLAAFMNSESFQSGIRKYASRAIGQSNISAKNLAEYPIPLPPLDIQQAIVARIEEERALVEANKTLIEHMKARIDEVMERVWG